MAIEQGLVQSGKNLFEATNAVPDFAGAYAEGEKMIKDQIDDNQKRREHAEDREFDLKRKQQEEELRTLGLEQAIDTSNENKAVAIGAIRDAEDQGLIQKANYPEWEAQGDDWIKDMSNRMKVFEDTGGRKALLGRLDAVIAGRDNWTNVVGLTKGSDISDSSPEAQKIDLAIDRWAQESNQPPPTKTIDGKDYFVLPSADGSEEITIPVDQLGKAQTVEDVVGQYASMASFDTKMADWQKGNADVFKRLSQGTGTSTDLASIGNWFKSNITTEIQAKEVADSFFIRSGITPGSELAKEIGIEDQNNDGQLTSEDINIDDFAEIFSGAVMAMNNFDENQSGDAIAQDAEDKKLGKGKYTKVTKGGRTGAKATRIGNRLRSAIDTGNYKDLQGLVVTTGVKGEYIQNVLTPGETYNKDGKETPVEEYLVQTSKGNVLRLGQDPSAGLSNILDIDVPPPAAPKPNDPISVDPNDPTIQPGSALPLANKGESGAAYAKRFKAWKKNNPPAGTPTETTPSEVAEETPVAFEFKKGDYEYQEGEGRTIRHLKERGKEKAKKIEQVRNDAKKECSIDDQSSKCKRLIKAADIYEKELERLDAKMEESYGKLNKEEADKKSEAKAQSERAKEFTES